MRAYTIFADTGCDISPALLSAWDVKCIHLMLSCGETHYADMPTETFYAQMREGKVFRTAAANLNDFLRAFGKVLAQGQDILYLAFSGCLSSTAATARIAAGELEEQYPGRKVLVVDTLCASAGYGLLLYLTVAQQRLGKSIEVAAAFAAETAPHVCHAFTVDDLVYLKRGGRVSAAAAVIGGILNVKPVLHVDNAGYLVPIGKVRGRKAAIQALANHMKTLALPDTRYFISHGDCPEDARYLEKLLQAAFGREATLITDIGPVIGAHSGPGTLALFFLGRHR